MFGLDHATARLNAILNSCPIGILLVDSTLNIQSANQDVRNLLRYTSADACQTTLYARLAEEDAPRVAEAAHAVLARRTARQVLEVTAIRCDGTAFACELSIAYIDDIDDSQPGLVCTVTDVTARQQTDAALRVSEERWQFALEGNGDGIWDWNMETGEVFYSARWKAMLGYADAEIGNTLAAWSSRVHTNDLERVNDAIDAHLNGVTEFYESEHRMRTREGEYRWVLDRGKVVKRAPDGRPQRFIGTHSDITQRKRIEMQFSRQSALQRILMDTALNFINIPIERLDEGILGVLQSVGEFNQADRAYIFDYDHTQGLMHNTYEWCAKEITPEIENLRNVPMELFPTWVNAHLQGDPVYIPDVSALPSNDPLYGVLAPQGIKSLITIPLIDGTVCLGFIGFDAVREHRIWSETDIVFLKLLAELLVNARRRSRNEASLKQTAERLAVSERRLRNAQRIARLGAWEYDVATDTVQWSAEVFNLFGMEVHPTAPNLATIMQHLYREDRPLLEQAMRRAIKAGEPYELELRVLRPDGSIVHTLSRGEPEMDSTQHTVRLIGSVLDITERKAGEMVLQQALEREKELSELKSRFVAMASHQLRTPLATILAAAETLLAYSDRLDHQQLVGRLTKIRAQVVHLQTIINDVLKLTRIEAGHHEYRPKELEMGAFCAAIIQEYMDRPQWMHPIRFQRPQTPLPMMLDPQIMRQAIDNIIDNAVKYSPPQAEITIRLRVEDDLAVLAISDRGIGIPDSSLRHLFTPFHRAANATMISGTGLGLPIAKEIVVLHGGRIGVETEIDVGTTVSIYLPIYKER